MSRESVLAAIRKGLGRPELDAFTRERLDQRRGAADREPLRPRLPGADLEMVFLSGLERVAATSELLDDRRQIPLAVRNYLAGKALPAAAAVAPALADLDWPDSGLELRFGATRGDDLCGVSEAFRGIAENGSLVLLSGAENPTSLNFLPDHHLVVLQRERLVAHPEDVWEVLRESIGTEWPRSVNLITGPSRTADIEQTIQLGAHGPRSLHVLLV